MPGSKNGVGRPSNGTRRSVALTMPDEVWEWVEVKSEAFGSVGTFLRWLTMRFKMADESMDEVTRMLKEIQTEERPSDAPGSNDSERT